MGKNESNVVLDIAKEIESNRNVPREFIQELLRLEAERMHLPERRGILKEIFDLLEKDYWPEEEKL